MKRVAGFGIVCLAAVLAVAPGRASLYQPDEPTSLSVTPAGTPVALPFAEFKRRLVTLANQLNPTLKTPERERLLGRIATRQKARTRAPVETVALAADLIRAGRPDDAAGVLARDRRGFLPNATLAHAAAARGDWRDAWNYQSIANDEAPPDELPGLTRPQLAWQLHLNKAYLLSLFEMRTKPRAAPEVETVEPLFPVTFVNDAGAYEPGVLAAAERAKLPADAVAVAQQLLLWLPTDTRLYWLLAEVYAATGDLEDAQRILDECVSSAREYGNRKQLVEHRTAVRAAAEARPKTNTGDEPLMTPAPADAPPEEPPVNMKMIWVYFGVVAAIALLAAARVLGRRGKPG